MARPENVSEEAKASVEVSAELRSVMTVNQKIEELDAQVEQTKAALRGEQKDALERLYSAGHRHFDLGSLGVFKITKSKEGTKLIRMPTPQRISL